MQESISLPDPTNRPQLEPFATLYAEVVLPEAARRNWFATQQQVPSADLERISRRLESRVAELLGHCIHPAIYVHALLVCGHFYYQAAAGSGRRRLTDLADAGFSLAQSLKLHHNLDDLYLLL